MPDEPVDMMEQLRPWIDRHTRVAWLPRTADSGGLPTASKFSGQLLLLKDEPWPLCGSCQQPLELLLQLNLAELPDRSLDYGPGMLQLFYCVGPAYCEPGWEPFSNVSLCRIIQPTAALPAAENHNRFPAKSIIGWEPIADLPSSAEHEPLGIEYNFHFRDVPYQPAEMWCKELNLHFVGAASIDRLGEEVTASASDKLAGWPCWVQGVEYPKCPECGNEMSYLFQMGSEDNVPYMFGDCGVGHITQCPQHKHVVAFGWACS